MFITDLNHLQSVDSTSVKGGSYYKNIKVYVKVDQYADGGYAKAYSYKGDAIADASATNKSYISVF